MGGRTLQIGVQDVQNPRPPPEFEQKGISVNKPLCLALAALIQLRERGAIDASARVVVISTASGLKFTDFKLGYHEGRLPQVDDSQFANAPVELPNDYDAVRRAIDQHAAGSP